MRFWYNRSIRKKEKYGNMKKGFLAFLLIIMMLSMSIQPVFGAEDESAGQIEEQTAEDGSIQEETAEELSETVEEEPTGSAEEEQEEPSEPTEETEEEPADSPAIVILSESPPKLPILSLTHCRAAIWSSKP